jgi:hypothetical protein
MHSHDKTLITSLGFQDPDKRNDRHDLACRYLVETAENVVRGILPKLNWASIDIRKAHMETVIAKGQGQYRQHIGFADATIDFVATSEPIVQPEHTLEMETYRATCMRCFKTDYISPQKLKPILPPTCSVTEQIDGRILVEVKIGRTPVNSILRQINLYKQYAFTDSYGGQYAMVVTDYALNRLEKRALEHEGIRLGRLSSRFDEWITESLTPAEDVPF